MSEKTSDRVVQLNARIPAAPERVYAALTDAEIAKQWWAGGPWSFEELVLEARPGGRFIYAIANKEDGSKYRTWGEYLHAVPPHRLVWTNQEGGGTYVSLWLEPDGNGTRLTAYQGVFATAEECAMHQQGWSGSIDQLAALLESD